MKAELGYRDAPVLRDGEKIIDTGGGVCQVSTTLYNTALLAGLKIIERHPHSRRVGYAPAGRDATVSFTEWKDLRFLNNHPAPLMIRARVEGERVIIGLFGQKNRGKEIRILTEENPSGQMRSGPIVSEVMTWRVTLKDGIEITKELISVDNY